MERGYSGIKVKKGEEDNMNEKELIAKIDNLEKRVETLEKEISTIAKINQSERVKEYIASTERARKIASLLDVSSQNDNMVDLNHGNTEISEILLNKSEIRAADEAKEYVDNIENRITEEIEKNNKVGNAYDWDTLFDYEEVDGQITIKSYIGFDDLDVVVIPDRINDLMVTKIGEKAFEHCNSIKEVVLPEFLIAVGDRAFCGSSITTITLPKSLIHIGENAFAFSKLEKINIPSKVERIPDSAFYYCSNLKEISFSEGIKSIDKKAFSECISLLKIDIPNSVKTIGKQAFDVGVINNMQLRIPDNCKEIFWGWGVDNIFGSAALRGKITIYCNGGSAAMQFARKCAIPVKHYEEFDLLEE